MKAIFYLYWRLIIANRKNYGPWGAKESTYLQMTAYLIIHLLTVVTFIDSFFGIHIRDFNGLFEIETWTGKLIFLLVVFLPCYLVVSLFFRSNKIALDMAIAEFENMIPGEKKRRSRLLWLYVFVGALALLLSILSSSIHHYI